MKILKYSRNIILSILVIGTGGLTIWYIGNWFSIPFIVEFTFIQAAALYMILRIGTLDTSAMIVSMKSPYFLPKDSLSMNKTSQLTTIAMNLSWLLFAWVYYSYFLH